ncbi:engulfment and cell motility protein 3 isoform X2 [Anabrus simplex]|uniref:engulfment and cell motility protein 3 isoform X2 n=1 Tax=Anabrus simplex TaxID=316456 RepID=UPI0034DD3679
MQEDKHNSKDIVSVAVEVRNEKILYKLNQMESLPEIIEKLCNENKIPHRPGQYSLQLTELGHSNEPFNKYVTEENRVHIKNGSILRLVYSPMEMCNIIHKKIQPGSGIEEEELLWVLEKLATLSKDRTFALEFVTKYDLEVVMSLIKERKPPFNVTTLCMEVVLVFLSHGLIPNIGDIPIESIVEFVISPEAILPKTEEVSLAILKFLLKSKKTPDSVKEFIRTKVSVQEILPHIWNRDSPKVQEYALAYINVLASGHHSSEIIPLMASEQVRDNLRKNILNNTSSTVPMSRGMAHELYVYQSILLEQLVSKLHTYVDPDGEDGHCLQELSNVSQSYKQQAKRDSIVSLIDEGCVENTKSNLCVRSTSLHEFEIGTPLLDKKSRKCAYELKSKSAVESGEEGDVLTDIHTYAGFSPSPDFCCLTLDCMLYFARKYLKYYTRIMLMEQNALKQPFYTVCDRLVKLLCDVLHVGQKCSKDCVLYQPLLFNSRDESPFFKELFCLAAVKMSNTRREMKARTVQDHEKVFKVLSHQIMEALKRQPETLKDLESYLQEWTYEKVCKEWQFEQERNLIELNHLPTIIDLRQRLRISMEELIHEQRLYLLCQGARFPKANIRGQKLKNKYWYICLSSNHMVFHYGDCTENETDPPECSSKVSVSNIRDLVTGKKCPHVKEAKHKPDFAFSLLLDLHLEPSSLDFIAPNQEVFDTWTDGLNVLLGTSFLLLGSC